MLSQIYYQYLSFSIVSVERYIRRVLVAYVLLTYSHMLSDSYVRHLCVRLLISMTFRDPNRKLFPIKKGER